MTLHCETQGEGRDLVLLHGWGMDGAIWSELARKLSARFRVHAVDLPGYGSSAPCRPYTLEGMAKTLAQNMPRACLVCGWSLGGQVALDWAKTAPRQVTRLALIATTPCFVRRDDWPHAIETRVLEDFTGALLTDCAGTMRRFFSLQALGDRRAKRVAARLGQRLSSGETPAFHVLHRGLQILRGADLRRHLDAIAQPTLVLQGDGDRLVPAAAGEFLSTTIPDAGLVRMSGAGHAPFVSDAAAVARELDDFFGRS